MSSPVIVWFRRNLRITDNPALHAAIETRQPIIAVYITDSTDKGGASRWWLHHSLSSLGTALKKLGSELVLQSGDPVQILASLARDIDAATIFYCRRFEPEQRRIEDELAESLDGKVDLRSFDDRLLPGPTEILTRTGTPFKVFSAYWKAARRAGDPASPLPSPVKITKPAHVPNSQPIGSFRLLPKTPDWSTEMQQHWQPGEAGAAHRLDSALNKIAIYAKERDRPDLSSTSQLSPHLHFGEVSARQVWHAIHSAAIRSQRFAGADALLRQLYWREFSSYLLYHFPQLSSAPLRDEFSHFPWTDNDAYLKTWQRGQTGYPLIDAGMRQLWAIGWMHNRVRMVTGSFLVKNLLIPWQRGLAWFADTLVDADLANNSASWQWVAGCGTDATPYFRIFNPVLQSRKFDPDGDYIRRWIPELKDLDKNTIHEPWKADAQELDSAGIQIGRDYPYPVVDLAESRQQALAAWDELRELRSLLQSDSARPGSSAG